MICSDCGIDRDSNEYMDELSYVCYCAATGKAPCSYCEGRICPVCDASDSFIEKQLTDEEQAIDDYDRSMKGL